LNSAAQFGVAIAFGSDAHAPDEVGMGFPEAVKSAKAAGYDQYCQFSNRKRTPAPL
jgi:histidinol-phosphatase (PHP family)